MTDTDLLTQLRRLVKSQKPRVRRSGNRFGPNKWTVGQRHANYLGPMDNLTVLLSHLGDREVLAVQTRDGSVLTWKEWLSVLLTVSPWFTMAQALETLGVADDDR